jgi:F1F0 ATPase subunit 2
MMDLIFLRVLPYGALGVSLAVAYFYALGLNVRLYTGSGPVWTAPLMHVARLLVIGAVFTLCARRGASSLLSCVAGFELMRRVTLNRQRLALGMQS